MPAGSYSTKLLEGGVPAIAAKIREECEEVIEAATDFDPDNRQPLVHESADVVFHLFVLLCHKGIALDEIRTELERREGISGIEEKKNRKQSK